MSSHGAGGQLPSSRPPDALPALKARRVGISGVHWWTHGEHGWNSNGTRLDMRRWILSERRVRQTTTQRPDGWNAVVASRGTPDWRVAGSRGSRGWVSLARLWWLVAGRRDSVIY